MNACPVPGCPPRKGEGRAIQSMSQHLRWAHGRWALEEYGSKAVRTPTVPAT